MEFFVRYAPKLILLVDAKALIYIRLAKESTGILLRFSLELSKYEADIIHVPGKDNEISDLLSRSHKDIESIQQDIADNRTISEKDSIRIVRALTLPSDFKLTSDQLVQLIEGPSPRNEAPPKSKRVGKAAPGVKFVKNTPTTLSNRKPNLPRLTNTRRPGVILPVSALTERNKSLKTTSNQGKAKEPKAKSRAKVKPPSDKNLLDNDSTRDNKQQTPLETTTTRTNNSENYYNLRNRKVSFDRVIPKSRPVNRINDKQQTRPSQSNRDNQNNGNSELQTSNTVKSRTRKSSTSQNKNKNDKNNEKKDCGPTPSNVSRKVKTKRAVTEKRPCGRALSNQLADQNGPDKSDGRFYQPDPIAISNRASHKSRNLGEDENLPLPTHHKQLAPHMGIDTETPIGVDLKGGLVWLRPSTMNSQQGEPEFIEGKTMAPQPLDLASTPTAELDFPTSRGNDASEDASRQVTRKATRLTVEPDSTAEALRCRARKFNDRDMSLGHRGVHTPPNDKELHLRKHNRNTEASAANDIVPSRSMHIPQDIAHGTYFPGTNADDYTSQGTLTPPPPGTIESDQANDFKSHLPHSYHTISTDSLLNKQGFLGSREFLTLQLQDQDLIERQRANDEFLKFDQGIYFYNHNLKGNKPLLPQSLARLLINSHHFSQPGLHKSRAQIIRDINSIYFINQKTLKELVDNDTGSCHVCQLFDTASQSERIGSLPRYDKPRLSWSLDLITDLPKSDKNFKIILLAVDDFSNYLIAVPLKDTSSIELIRAIRNHIFTPFGCPKSIRTDEQPSIYNSREFYEFLKRHSVELFATAVASPFSNGRAERHIKTFKHSARKYFYQNNCINQWDEHLTFIVNSLNTSINSFNHSPEEIMFGQTLPSKLKLIDIKNNDSQAEPSSAIDKLIERANKARTDYQNRKKMKEASNATFKNKTSIDKNFNLGDLVLHRQLQVSTGTSSKWKPIFNGPFVIETVNKDKTFSCRNLLNNKVIKAHSTNLTHYKIDRSTIKLNSDQLSKPIFKQS
jgi:hypothetical protein